MKLYINTGDCSWKSGFAVKDETGTDKYFAGAAPGGNALIVKTAEGRDVLAVRKKLSKLMPAYSAYQGDTKLFEVRKRFGVLRQAYDFLGPGWRLEGNIMEHNYTIFEAGAPLLSVTQCSAAWGESYELDIPDARDHLAALAAALVIDCTLILPTGARQTAESGSKA